MAGSQRFPRRSVPVSFFHLLVVAVPRNGRLRRDAHLNTICQSEQVHVAGRGGGGSSTVNITVKWCCVLPNSFRFHAADIQLRSCLAFLHHELFRRFGGTYWLHLQGD